MPTWRSSSSIDPQATHSAKDVIKIAILSERNEAVDALVRYSV